MLAEEIEDYYHHSQIKAPRILLEDIKTHLIRSERRITTDPENGKKLNHWSDKYN